MNKNDMQRKSGDALYLTCFDHSLTTDCAGELTLPDYYPEIRRIVSACADALPDSKYLSDGNIELGGTVAFTVLYIGDDGSLTSAPYVTEYSQSIPIRGDFDGASDDIFSVSTAENVVCRPLAPRTISFKAKIKSQVRAYKKEDCSLTVKSDGDTPATSLMRHSLERLEDCLPTVKCKSLSTTGSLSGEIEATPGTKPIYCKGTVLIRETLIGRECIDVKGEVEISCLVLSGDGVFRTVRIPLPFEEHISAEGIEGSDIAAAYGRAASVNVSAKDNGALLFAEAEYDVDVHVARPMEASVTEDVYSTLYSLEKIQEERNVASLVCLKNASRSVSGEGPRHHRSGEGDHVIYTTARVQGEKIEVHDKTIAFCGSCDFYAVIASGGDCITEELSVPIKLEFAVHNVPLLTECNWEMYASPARAECRIEGERIFGKCELYIFAEAVRESKCAPVTGVSIVSTATSPVDRSTVSVFYPEKGKRLWDFAKECRFSISECESTNRVKRTDLSDGTPLIVK